MNKVVFLLSCPFSQTIRPTVLIGTSGKGKTFTKEVVEAMSSINSVRYNINFVPLVFLIEVCIDGT